MFLYVLGRSAGPGEHQFWRCLWLTLGTLFGAISNPQLVAPSAGPESVLKEPSCAASLAFTSTRAGLGREIMFQSSQRSTFTCRLSVRLNHWNCLQLYSSAARLKLHRVEWEGFLKMVLLLYPRLMPHVEECSAQEIRFLQYGGWLSSEVLVADPSALFPEPPAPDFAHMAVVCSALPLPAPRVSGYKRNFVCWPFKRLCITSCLCLVDRNHTALHW